MATEGGGMGGSRWGLAGDLPTEVCDGGSTPPALDLGERVAKLTSGDDAAPVHVAHDGAGLGGGHSTTSTMTNPWSR